MCQSLSLGMTCALVCGYSFTLILLHGGWDSPRWTAMQHQREESGFAVEQEACDGEETMRWLHEHVSPWLREAMIELGKHRDQRPLSFLAGFLRDHAEGTAGHKSVLERQQQRT